MNFLPESPMRGPMPARGQFPGTPPPAATGRQVTPLTVIGSVVGVAGTLACAIVWTTGVIQIILTFTVAFLSVLFFVGLWMLLLLHRPPSEYSAPVGPDDGDGVPVAQRQSVTASTPEKEILTEYPKEDLSEVMRENLANDYSKSLRHEDLAVEGVRMVLRIVADHLRRKTVQRDSREGLVRSLGHLFGDSEGRASKAVELLIQHGYLESPCPDRYLLSEKGYQMVRRQ
jgi:hypothetical protein